MCDRATKDKVGAYRTLRRIDARTARELREVVFEEPLTSQAQAEALASLARDVPGGDPAWTRFYGEALADWHARSG